MNDNTPPQQNQAPPQAQSQVPDNPVQRILDNIKNRTAIAIDASKEMLGQLNGVPTETEIIDVVDRGFVFADRVQHIFDIKFHAAIEKYEEEAKEMMEKNKIKQAAMAAQQGAQPATKEPLAKAVSDVLKNKVTSIKKTKKKIPAKKKKQV